MNWLLMKFKFEGEFFQGKKIGYVGDKNQLIDFVEDNKAEIEDIITDYLEEQEVFQWDEIDIELRFSKSPDDGLGQHIFLAKDFQHENTYEDDILVRKIKGTIFCTTDEGSEPI